MRLFVTALIVSFVLAGCGNVSRGVAKLTGYSEHCVDGVTYLQFPSGATVKYNPDGSIATCN